MKNLKVQSKILAVSIGAIVAMMAISVMIIVVFTEINNLLMHHTSSGQESLLKASTDIMNMRRMTGMIHAFAGDEERIDGYQADFNASYEAVNKYMDEYLEFVKNNPNASEDELNGVISDVDGMRELLKQYKTLLFEPNVENAKKSDIEALGAANAQYGTLIISVSDGIEQLVNDAGDSRDEYIEYVETTTDRIIVIFVAIIIPVVIIALWFTFHISSLISKPLLSLERFMIKAGTTGDIALDPREAEVLRTCAEGRDEISVTVAACLKFIEHVHQIERNMSIIAEGDLTNTVNLQSDRDSLGGALKRMQSNLDDMLGKVRLSTDSVYIASKEISQGAQSLAQASSEQSASVVDLTGSISEISEQIKDNADNVTEAAALSSEIKGRAEKGSGLMGELMKAVGEISEASNQIEKVIKVIDDIAFQTNILALNAAVEAARAGEAGKGFAVVAEEVRNLASKSAQAAKNTSGLIENSIDKANLGLSLATETASSLNEIVEGIKHNAEIVAHISSSTEHQQTSISNLNANIEQVANVVQVNSATAEQSAAASVEMNGQTDSLRELVSRFKT